ncbi:MAG TPA: OmpA family protein [Kofleriaceae bacterium]|nr:OmpA family protein [Kofleriaceae bacterium]
MRSTLLLLVVVASGCSGHAKLELKAPAPKIVELQPPPKPEPKVEPPPALVEATTTGAEIDVPGSIEFEPDKAQLHHSTVETRGTLEAVLKILQDNPSITRVRIEGHTDGDGSEAHNQYLSDHRAIAVVEWLVTKGVARNRLVAVGCAASDPIVPNTSAANKQRNRRTEFDIEELDGKRPSGYTQSCAPNPKRTSE